MSFDKKYKKYQNKYLNLIGGASSQQIIDRIINDNFNGNDNIIQNRDELIQLYECLNNPHSINNYMNGYRLIHAFIYGREKLEYHNIEILDIIFKSVIQKKSASNNLNQYDKDTRKILGICRFLINHNTNRLDNSLTDYIELLRLRIIIVNIVEEKTNISKGPETYILQYLGIVI